MTEPQDCNSLDEVRSAIDQLDLSLITTLSRRQEYVHAAASFKNNEEQVHANERQRTMLAARRLWAESKGVDPDLIEALFRTMVEHFIQAEMTVFSENRGSQGKGQTSTTSAAAAAADPAQGSDS